MHAAARLKKKLAFFTLFTLSVLCTGIANGEGNLNIPQRPNDFFIYDATSTLYNADMDSIGELQKVAFEQYQTPIIVVVIDRMSSYGNTVGIEAFSRFWFDSWGIGAEGSNKGILFLVSLQDRQARIELGADWGRKWDDHTQRIMNRQIVPRFRDNRYPDGIIAGVAALGEMAKLGPSATPPDPSWGETVEKAAQNANQLSYFEPPIMGLLVGLGLVLIVAGVFIPGQRKWLIGGGVTIIILAVFTYVVVGILALLMGGNNRTGGSRSGGYSSSGGFSGGFSGGGGATGSW